MEKKENIKELLDYAIAKLESQEKMSVEERDIYKKLVKERGNLDKQGYTPSWNPIWSIVSNLGFRILEEIFKQ